VNISHTFIGDLLVRLVAPDNRTVILHARTAESTHIETTYPSLTSPADNMEILNGMNVFGKWILSVSDMDIGDHGTFNSWALNIFYSNLTETLAPTRTTARPPTTTTRSTTRTTTSQISRFVERTSSPALSVPDMQTVSNTIRITEIGRLTSIIVTVNITHTYIGDLVVRLTAPDSTAVVLHNGSGGSADNIITSYPSPSLPFGNLGVLSGKAISGNWTLSVTDQYMADQGVFNSWVLRINYGN
jgi:subtilisin-like proprotein convertase family protein